MIRNWKAALIVAGVMAWGAAAVPAFGADVKMLSTGVGLESRVPHPEYSLLVIFAEAKGALLANLKVDVKNQAGTTVVTTVSEGPWLFLGLPAGSYKVSATRHNGVTKSASVDVAEKGQAVLRMAW